MRTILNLINPFTAMNPFHLFITITICCFSIKAQSQNQSIKSIHQMVETWHQAATDADADKYFGLMTTDSYFLGTDQNERWSKKEFQSFAKNAFSEAPAWDFKTIERNIIVDDTGYIAWFDERLDTWMGVCRGSGVVVKKANDWKIKHYVLSVTVPNEKIKDFILLMENQ